MCVYIYIYRTFIFFLFCLCNQVDTKNLTKQRCIACKKKVGLIGFSCRCKEMFFSVHRYPEEHACTFDYKSAGRVTLAKENPPCRRDKLETRIYDVICFDLLSNFIFSLYNQISIFSQ
ncbi:hypothetical protein R3W88_020349 [Solanum pinnatisectum]|uniref:AN1-type domain-containing protein n=1 Tax=Solanum pinnatisectum TaxID=50273 RepID=A0AAV9KM16_9SOLN|nr:hypothetical protein R3W88_020349 [Solanum pinnatisectum]